MSQWAILIAAGCYLYAAGDLIFFQGKPATGSMFLCYFFANIAMAFIANGSK